MTINEMWKSYREKCVAPDAGKVQIREIRYAFYMGFFSMMEINKAIGDDTVSEKKAINLLNSLDNELKVFIAERLKDAASKESYS